MQSGAVALAVSVTFLLGAFMNVVEPHYDRVQYSVQTRCQVGSAIYLPCVSAMRTVQAESGHVLCDARN
eukprot:1121285-Rhodomonas_salina.1